MSEETNVTNIKKGKKTKVAKVKAPKAEKVKRAKVDHSAECACQCGAIAKGGGFMPGHDSRLAGILKRVIGGKPYEGERSYAAKIAKSKNSALETDHFRKLFAKLPE